MSRAYSPDRVSAGWDEDRAHPTHGMTDWESTLCVDIGRFGSERECVNCGGTDLRCGGAGSRWIHRELLEPCYTVTESEDKLPARRTDRPQEWIFWLDPATGKLAYIKHIERYRRKLRYFGHLYGRRADSLDDLTDSS